MHRGRQGGRQREGDRGGKMTAVGRRLRGIRVARVKLETYPFNMSYLSILSVKRGARGTTPTVQRPNSIQWWNRGQLLASRANCNGSRGMEIWSETPLPTPATHLEIKGKRNQGGRWGSLSFFFILFHYDTIKAKMESFKMKGRSWVSIKDKCGARQCSSPLKKKDWCAHGPSSSRYFYHGPRWDWIQMGHLITSFLFLSFSLSLSLSLSLLWAGVFLRSHLTPSNAGRTLSPGDQVKSRELNQAVK